jgi:hypothetical protein
MPPVNDTSACGGTGQQYWRSLEHLADTVRVMEEIWRISAPGARVTIRVPYWNSMHSITDPTHVKMFNQHSFEFFDPTSVRCRKRPYYSTARFRITRVTYFVNLLLYFRVSNPLAKAVLALAARHLNGIIWVIEFELTAVKP